MKSITSIFTKRRIIAIASVLLVLIIAYAGTSWYVVSSARKAEVKPIDQYPSDLGMAYQNISFHPRGNDSINLSGWWMPATADYGTIIWVHGLDQNRATQLDLLKSIVDAGYNVLAFDLRGHGESSHVPITAGYKEPNDVRGAIDYALNHENAQPGKIILMGRSFGAAIVLMTGYNEPAVAGVYADSSFATLSQVLIGEVVRRTPIPHWAASLLKPGIIMFGNLYGIDVKAVSPVAAVAKYTYPIGLVHCLDDQRIPVQQAYELRNAVVGPVWFNLYPKCDHADAYKEFPGEYTSIVIGYFDYVVGVDSASVPEPSTP